MNKKTDWKRLVAAFLCAIFLGLVGLGGYFVFTLFLLTLPQFIGFWSYVIAGMLLLSGIVYAIYHDMGKQEE